jgi:hypothetical protein
MFDHLKRHHQIERSIRKRQRFAAGLQQMNMGFPEVLPRIANRLC